MVAKDPDCRDIVSRWMCRQELCRRTGAPAAIEFWEDATVPWQLYPLDWLLHAGLVLTTLCHAAAHICMQVASAGPVIITPMTPHSTAQAPLLPSRQIATYTTWTSHQTGGTPTRQGAIWEEGLWVGLAVQLHGSYGLLVHSSSPMAVAVLGAPGQAALHQLHAHVQPGPEIVTRPCASTTGSGSGSGLIVWS